MKEITLTRGLSAIVDDDDFVWLNGHKWSIDQKGYVNRSIYPDGRIAQKLYMHRAIKRPDKGVEVDHINGNKLDNRRSNLRLCTHADNMRNSRGYSKTSTGLRGVHFAPTKGRFRSQITLNGKRINLGSFPSLHEAFQAYRSASLDFHGEFSVFAINPTAAG